MLILAGLLEMLAIGSILLVESSANTDETDDGISPDTLTDDVTTQIGDTSTDFLSYMDEDGVTQINPNETTDGEDLLIGTNAADDLIGADGNDTLLGGLDNDTLVGSARNDLLDGGEGSDLLNGGGGDGALNSWEETTESTDFLNGGDGNDTIFAGADDQVSGGLGTDATVLSTNMDGAAQIWGFESGQDTLVFVYEAGDRNPR